jgi:hypothetical protein
MSNPAHPLQQDDRPAKAGPGEVVAILSGVPWPRCSCPSALQPARHFGLSMVRRERVCRAHGENALSVSAVSGELHFGEACRQNGRLNLLGLVLVLDADAGP